MAVSLGHATIHRTRLDFLDIEVLAGWCEKCGPDQSRVFLDSESAWTWAIEHMFDH